MHHRSGGGDIHLAVSLIVYCYINTSLNINLMHPTNHLAQYRLYADQFGRARAQERRGGRGRASPESMRESECVMGKDADGEG